MPPIFIDTILIPIYNSGMPTKRLSKSVANEIRQRANGHCECNYAGHGHDIGQCPYAIGIRGGFARKQGHPSIATSEHIMAVCSSCEAQVRIGHGKAS